MTPKILMVIGPDKLFMTVRVFFDCKKLERSYNFICAYTYSLFLLHQAFLKKSQIQCKESQLVY